MSSSPGLKNFDPRAFLKDYWQCKPLLVRQAYPAFKNPLTRAQLITLATRQVVEARLILERGGTTPWELRHGPFTRASFKALPPSHWTLLVQRTNYLNDALQTLLEDFYFIPQWRIEDIMTSYAVRAGSVGAHVDNYDVFLLQAEGRREWRIGATPVVEDDFKPGHAVKLLRRFKPAQTFILEPGDILYLPPRYAHHGVALTEHCITHSIGLRAPSVAELIDDYSTHVLSSIDEGLRYTDADLKWQPHSGEITEQALTKIVAHVRARVADAAAIRRWFGQYITQPHAETTLSAPVLTATELRKRLRAGAVLRKNPASKFAYVNAGKTIYFYANGEEFSLPPTMLDAVQLLTAKHARLQAELSRALKGPAFVALLTQLIANGNFYLELFNKKENFS